MREASRISECGCTARDSILKFRPLSRLARDRVDVKDIVFPFRLVRAAQEEVVGVGEGEVWDRREQGLEDHGHSAKWWREGKGRPLGLRCGGGILCVSAGGLTWKTVITESITGRPSRYSQQTSLLYHSFS